jgi:hypothetical protein
VWSASAPALILAQGLPAAERDALVRLRVDRGGRAGDVDALIRLTDDAAANGLPVAPLTNKIREGLAKGHDPQRIEPVIRQLAAHLGTASQLIRELDPASGAGREAAVTLLAEALGGGVTPDEVRDLRRQGQAPGRPPLTADGVASAAKGFSFIKETRLPAAEGAAVIAESLRQGYRSQETLALGREVKRRERDYQTGRATLRALRDAIARGDRPEQLFRDSRIEPLERPSAGRTGTAV